MRFQIYSLIAAVLVVLSTAVPTLAQEDPLTVVPVGRVLPIWELTYRAVASVPSPIGDALPGLVDGGPGGVTLRLGLDRIQYAYDCGEDRCIGSAGDVWLALPADQQQSYVDQVLDVVNATFPGQLRRRLAIVGAATARSNFRTIVDQDSNGNRTYNTY